MTSTANLHPPRRFEQTDTCLQRAMLSWLVVGILATVWLSYSGLSMAQERRVALVIGNKDYANQPLENSINDARDLRALLTRLGFDVLYGENLDFEHMDAKVHEFVQKVGPDTEALFYFSGHGVQADGSNYLVPVGVSISSKAEVKSRAYNASDVIGNLEEARSRVSVLILDACRDEPFRGVRSASRGLAEMGGGSGTIIAYAAAPGETAQDGDGRNGTFTKHLLRAMAKPGIPAITALQIAQTAVAEETRNEQKPWINFGPQRGEFCFTICGTPTATPAPVVDDAAVELKFWDSMANSKHPEEFEAYLKRYPRGRFIELAKQRLERLNSALLKAPQPLDDQSAPSAPPTASRKKPIARATDGCPGCPETIALPGGTFWLGSDNGRKDEQPRHKVTIRPFRMGRYEVSQREWRDVMGNNPSQFKDCDECPVESVSLREVQEFIDKLNRRSKRHYRLPTEAEWEYACRAGEEREICGADGIDAIAWYRRNADGKTHPVGEKAPNAFGLYDLSGNVAEWTGSEFTKRYDGSETVSSNSTMSRRVVRGGAWHFKPIFARAGFRFPFAPENRHSTLGFRVAAD